MGAKADIGLIGLAVMGQNLVLNMNDHGFTVAVFNRTTSRVDNFLQGEAKGTNIIGTYSIEELARSLKQPRRVMLMIKAGKPVDESIESLIPHLEKGDIIIDGGNSNYEDSIRRTKYLESQGLHFIGTGISGGEEGARYGPSIMPGGSLDAWPFVKEIFQEIAAKVDDGSPCCDWVGSDGAGHFVKMVHNGIEYGDMQLISEAYHLMKSVLGLSYAEMHDIFATWNEGVLDSYLIEITGDILAVKDVDGTPLLEKILDAAGQKGTGRWTAINALELGIPLSLVGEAVMARALSALKNERSSASKILSGPEPHFEGDVAVFVDHIRQALYAYFKTEVDNAQASWRRVVGVAVENGIPVPAMSSALAFYDGYRSERLPANLLQAQRDYFGAHTYERVDRPRGEFFHTKWTGTGGGVTSSTYDA
jgi:6-phosphogluconate dehydrogenase